MEVPCHACQHRAEEFYEPRQRGHALGDRGCRSPLSRSFAEAWSATRWAGASGAREDSEDVVQEALIAFYRAVADRRTQLDHSGGLWPLLKQFTHHKIMQHVEHHLQQVRDVARERQIDLAKFPLAGPTETDAAELIDQIETAVRRLLGRPGMKPRDAEILRSKLRGESSKQTARALDCSVATVNRTLAVLLPQLEESLGKANGDCPRNQFSKTEFIPFQRIEIRAT